MGRKLWDAPPVTQSLAENVSEAARKYYFYDIADRLIMAVLPPVDDPYDNPDQGETVHPIYRYYYDTNSNQTAILDPLGRATVFEYDHENRLTKQYMPYQVTFDGVNLSDSAKYADLEAQIYNNLPTGWKFEQKWYDSFGRLEKEKDYAGQYTVYGYYDAQTMYDGGEFVGAPGQIMLADYYIADPSIGDNLRSSIRYTYDRLGRKTSETMVEYDLIEQVLTMTYQQTWSYTYDIDGNLTQILQIDQSDPQNPITTSTLDYTYNPITGQKLTAETGNSITGYGYDDLGRLESVSSQIWTGTQFQSRGATAYAYNPNGSRASVTLPNDIFTEYTYNGLNRLTNLTHYTSVQKTDSVGSYDYALAADGMRTQADEYIKKYTGTDEQVIDYGYDNLNRLESETVGTSYSVTYTYDLAGNRLTREVYAQNGILSTIYTYDPDTDRLLTEVHSGPIATVSWLRDKPITLYASADGGTYYRLPDSPRKIGHLEAWFYGLPTALSRYILISLAVITLAALLGPSSLVLYRRLRRMPRAKRSRLSVVHRTLCLLLAWVFLIDPEVFRQTAYADSQYEQVSTFTWADGNHTIEYGYDENGSLTSKVTVRRTGPSTTEFVEGRRYEYNLQNRLTRLWDAGPDDLLNTADDVLLVEYRYNPQGIRIEKITNETTPAEWTTYLIDPANPTGYAQVLEETTYTDDGQGEWTPASRIHYCVGDDVLAQTRSAWDTDRWTAAPTQFLLYDGHGSARQLAGSTQSIQENYNYDGYGALLQGSSAESNPGVTPEQDTSLLYAGEQFDASSQFYNNRARWYNPLNGRFNRVDPFSGNTHDPKSLHKYAYCHANPINGIDPSGKLTLTELSVVTSILLFLMMGMHIAAHGWREKSKEILAVENSQAISHLSPGNLDLYERDMYETKDPSVRQMHYEFWHDLGEMNKAVTIYNLTAEKRLLQAIDYSYHALEVVDIGLSGVSLFVTATSAPRIIWGTTKVHGTPDHMLSIARNAVAEQFDPDVKAIYVHKRLSDILKRPIKGTDYIPDLALEYHSGYFGIYEWRSPGQPYNKLLEKGWKYKEEMGSSLRFYDIKEIGQNIY